MLRGLGLDVGHAHICKVSRGNWSWNMQTDMRKKLHCWVENSEGMMRNDRQHQTPGKDRGGSSLIRGFSALLRPGPVPGPRFHSGCRT